MSMCVYCASTNHIGVAGGIYALRLMGLQDTGGLAKQAKTSSTEGSLIFCGS